MHTIDSVPKVVTVSIAKFLAPGSDEFTPGSHRFSDRAWSGGRADTVDQVLAYIREQDADIVGVTEIWDLDLARCLADALQPEYGHSSLIVHARHSPPDRIELI